MVGPMQTAIIIALIGAAATVVASVLSALVHRARVAPASSSAAAVAGPDRGRRLGTFRVRLAVGLSALALVVGFSLACLAQGGWFNQRPHRGDSWLITPLTDLSEALGLRPVSLVPLTGLGLALVGAVGLVVGWSAAAPPEARRAEPLSVTPDSRQ